MTTEMIAMTDGARAESIPVLTLAQVQAQTQNTITALPAMTDEAVIATARSATMLATCAYVLRGACASELLGRQPRLVGGRGRKDVDGQGRKAYLARLAAEFGINARTLLDDLRIYEQFFARDVDISDQNAQEEATAITRYVGLGRDHFRAALAAPDPVKALEAAIGTGEDGVCPVRHMRAVVQASKNQEGKSTAQPDGGLVFDTTECSTSDPLSIRDAPASAVNTSLGSATKAGAITWEETLGEDTAALLRKLVARHNTTYPADALDAVGFLQRLVKQAARHVDDNLPTEAEISPAPVYELMLA